MGATTEAGRVECRAAHLRQRGSGRREARRYWIPSNGHVGTAQLDLSGRVFVCIGGRTAGFTSTAGAVDSDGTIDNGR